MYYVIDLKRLVQEIQTHKQNRTHAMIDWFYSPERILHVFVSRDGNKYLYRDLIEDPSLIPVEIKDVLQTTNQILGVALNEDLFPEEEDTNTITFQEAQ